MLRFIKLVVRHVVFGALDLFLRPAKEVKPKTLLLIRLDAIGDYILFRNFIKILANSRKYRDYRITLLGNSAWKDLAASLDYAHVADFIWLDRVRFNRNLTYRYFKLKEILSQGYEVVISPAYSREFFYADNIVKLVSSKEKIGSAGDLGNSNKYQKSLSDTYYTRLVSADDKVMFEFYRNKEFFESLLSTDIDIDKPTLELEKSTIVEALPENYVVFFIGASLEGRKWSYKYFAEVARFINDNFGLDVVLCGGDGDIGAARKMTEFIDGLRLYDFTGKTSLVELTFVISQSMLLVSNETLAPHFAVASDVPTVVLYNGKHLGRFTPYPDEITNKYYVAYHPQIESDIEKHAINSNDYGYTLDLDINEITVDKVKSLVVEAIDDQNL